MTNNNKKIAIISGGSGYLGREIVKKLEEEKFQVFSLSKNEGVDISDPVAVEKEAERIKNEYGHVDTLIHTASAPLSRTKLLDDSFKNFQSQFEVNVTGAFNLLKYFVPLLSQNSAIIGITSSSIEPGYPHKPHGSYTPAKKALRELLRILMLEKTEDHTLRIYAVAPSFMPGGLNKDIPKEIIEFLQNKDSDNFTTPEKVVSVIWDLINDTDGKMSGKSILVPSQKISDL